MLSRLSTTADAVNGAIIFVTVVSVIFLVGITILMVYFALKYNRRRAPVGKDIHGHTLLELAWTVIPTILAFMFFWYGWVGYRLMKSPPEDAIQVSVTGRQWSWSHEYANGVQSADLYVPLDRPVKVNLTSTDVIHSYYIPAFKVKQDVVPGVPNLFLWFQATQLGDYDVLCAEYCGNQHSYMHAFVHVVTQEDYDAWFKSEGEKVAVVQKALAAVSGGSAEGASAGGGAASEAGGTSEATLVALGKTLAQSKGCTACHSTDGSRLIGPSYKDIYGHVTTVVSDGTTHQVTVDDAYIKKSMLNPTADVVEGFQPLMPSQQGLVTDAEIKALTAYIKSLQ